MGISIKFRRGTAAEHSSFNGAEGEITVQKSDSSGDPWRLRVHDGLGVIIFLTLEILKGGQR